MKDAPFIIGLAGKAGSGKTAVANRLAPREQTYVQREGENWGKLHQAGDEVTILPAPAFWDHLYFALPLYKMASIRQKTAGPETKDRILYELHQQLYDLFGKSMLYGMLPSYEEFIELVHHVSTAYCEPDGVKPRNFLEEVGSLCREYNKDCFVRWMERQVRTDQASLLSDEDEASDFVVVISDVRRPNEANWITNQPRSVLIKLVAEDEVRAVRVLERDGISLARYESEEEIDNIVADFEINTTNTKASDVAEQIKRLTREVDA